MEPVHSALAGLPPAYGWLVPELLEIPLPEETRATCASCAMVPPPGEDPDDPRFFLADVRCCGYHPSLPNHRLGRILAGGGAPAALVRARLAEVSGANMHSLDPSTERSQRYALGASRGFGRDPGFRCPYWVGGDLACGIWEHREAICRTWFCRHVDGLRGLQLWAAVRAAIAWVDDHLSIWLVNRGAPPPKDAGAEAWEAWYAWCHERLESAPRAEVEALANDRLRALRQELREAHAALERPLPDVVEPGLRTFVPVDGGYRVTGAATWDPMVLPGSLFAFLSQFDGARHWADALADAGEPARGEFTDEIVHGMLMRGVLQEPESS